MLYLINNVVSINMNVPSQTEYDNIRTEYGIIVEESVIPKYPTVTFDGVWGVFTKQQVLKISVKNQKNKDGDDRRRRK